MQTAIPQQANFPLWSSMDLKTLRAYEQHAHAFASDWHAQPPPIDLHAVVRKYFVPGGRTADIGCGSGRDTAWLAAEGYPAVGFDSSAALLAEARRRYPHLRFQLSALPDLPDIADNSVTNVLCETVIMHLDSTLIDLAVRRLMAILEAGGTLYLSWRVTSGSNQRDEHGRLYTAFNSSLVVNALPNTEILLDEQVSSASSGKTVHRVVVRKK
ncbi:MAG TPA: class I SAM-dependent methyltransferase [Pirellulales bacterium]|jgi:trans-aconitate methyltransferase|nr:class I SAM-dependent methyltransferase [Pirellulales bacterium]